MKANWIVLLLFTLGLNACNQPEQSNRFLSSHQEDVTFSLIRPIVLSGNQNTVLLRDFVLFPDSFEVSVPDDARLTLHRYADSVVLKGELSAPFTVLSLKNQDLEVDIPVFSSELKTIEIKLSDSSNQYQTVCFKSELNGWSNTDTMSFENQTWVKTLEVGSGKYEYLFLLDGQETPDPNNPEQRSNGMGGFNSILTVEEDAKAPVQQPNYVRHNASSISFQLPEGTDLLVFWENHQLDTSWVRTQNDTATIQIPANARSKNLSHLRIYPHHTDALGKEVLIPLLKGEVNTDPTQLPRTARHNYRMYFLMVDRFANGTTANDQPLDHPNIHPLANYMGGDMQGVTKQMETGYFDQLNLNTIWLSPIGQNPQGAWGLWDKNGVTSTFSGYHGYWPTESKKVDFRMGGDSGLTQLIDSAHARNQNIILDYVANHVHQNHPVYQNNKDWATPLYLPDGTMNTEKWDEHRLTTWFDTFLPTLELRNAEVADAMTDSALFWFENYAIDGFRHDATKHIPESFWRLLNKKLRARVLTGSDRSIFQIGETYGSPQLINSYVSGGLLDAQFDFNLYDAAVRTFATGTDQEHTLATVLNSSISTYGQHHLMGNISGNQDRVRFISYADGSVSFEEDGKNAGWTRDIEHQNEAIGFERLALLHAFNFTIPGIPIVYYGDEIGMPGGNDPDNRRMMRFDNLNEWELNLKSKLVKLAALRAEHPSLVYGITHINERLVEGTICYSRAYLAEVSYVAINYSDESKTVRFTVPANKPNETFESAFNNDFELSGNSIELTLPPRSYEVITENYENF